MLSGTAPGNRKAVLQNLVKKGHQIEGLNVPEGGQQQAQQDPSMVGQQPEPSREQIQEAVNKRAMTQGMTGPFGRLGIGIGKGAMSTISGASELGQRGLQFLTGIKPKTGDAGPFQTRGGIVQLKDELTTPEGLEENVGFFGEQIAEFVIPGMVIDKAHKAVAVPEKLTKLQKVLNLGKKSAEGAALFGGVTAIQEGDINEDVGVSAAIGAAFPLAEAGVKAIGKFLTKKLPSRMLNKILHTHTKEFKFGKDPGLTVAKEKIVGNSLDDISRGIDKRMTKIGKDITKKVSKSSQAPTNAKRIIEDIINKNASKISDPNSAARLKAVTDQIFKSTKYSTKSGALIPKGAKDLTKLSAKELHALQQQVGKLTQWTGQAYEKPVNQILKDIYVALGKKLPSGTQALQARWASLLGAQRSMDYALANAARRNMIGAGSAAGALLGSQYGNEGNRAQNAIIGAILPAIMRMPAVRSRIGAAAANAEVSKEVTNNILRSVLGGATMVGRDDEVQPVDTTLPDMLKDLLGVETANAGGYGAPPESPGSDYVDDPEYEAKFGHKKPKIEPYSAYGTIRFPGQYTNIQHDYDEKSETKPFRGHVTGHSTKHGHAWLQCPLPTKIPQNITTGDDYYAWMKKFYGPIVDVKDYDPETNEWSIRLETGAKKEDYRCTVDGIQKKIPVSNQ